MQMRNTLYMVAYRFIVLFVTATALGVVVSLTAIAFIEAVSWLNNILLVAPHARVQVLVQQPWLLIAATLLVPTLGGLLVGLMIQTLSPTKRPLGPPDAVWAVQLRQPLPGFRAGVVSTLASIVSLGCGASVGQYGPMVYLGSMAGNQLARLKLQIPNLSSVAMACGVAAAIATAFNAPIAGLIFAHEVILRHYSLQAFAPTTVASVTGYFMANVVFERPPLFLVEFAGVTHGYEFVLFALMGIICGFLAVGFMKLILRAPKVAQATGLPPMFRPAAAGFVLGLVALGLPDVLGIGQEVLRFATIEGAFAHWELALLVVAKILVTAMCVGFGFAGGVFSPSLLIGILFGALFWTVLNFFGVPNSGIAVYAICGMMALTSPVIGAPLTTILIVFELTRNYDLTIAAMVGVVFANLLTYRLFGRSLFDVQLASRGLNLSSGRDRGLLENAKVIDQHLDKSPLILRSDQHVAAAQQALVAAGRAEAIILNEEGLYQGVVRLQDTQKGDQVQVTDIYTQEWPTFTEKTSIWQAMLDLEDFVGEAVPVVQSTTGELIGTVTEASLINAYLSTVHDLRREENEAV